MLVETDSCYPSGKGTAMFSRKGAYTIKMHLCFRDKANEERYKNLLKDKQNRSNQVQEFESMSQIQEYFDQCKKNQFKTHRSVKGKQSNLALDQSEEQQEDQLQGTIVQKTGRNEFSLTRELFYQKNIGCGASLNRYNPNYSQVFKKVQSFSIRSRSIKEQIKQDLKEKRKLKKQSLRDKLKKMMDKKNQQNHQVLNKVQTFFQKKLHNEDDQQEQSNGQQQQQVNPLQFLRRLTIQLQQLPKPQQNPMMQEEQQKPLIQSIPFIQQQRIEQPETQQQTNKDDYNPYDMNQSLKQEDTKKKPKSSKLIGLYTTQSSKSFKLLSHNSLRKNIDQINKTFTNTHYNDSSYSLRKDNTNQFIKSQYQDTYYDNIMYQRTRCHSSHSQRSLVDMDRQIGRDTSKSLITDRQESKIQKLNRLRKNQLIEIDKNISKFSPKILLMRRKIGIQRENSKEKIINMLGTKDGYKTQQK